MVTGEMIDLIVVINSLVIRSVTDGYLVVVLNNKAYHNGLYRNPPAYSVNESIFLLSNSGNFGLKLHCEDVVHMPVYHDHEKIKRLLTDCSL